MVENIDFLVFETNFKDIAFSRFRDDDTLTYWTDYIYELFKTDDQSDILVRLSDTIILSFELASIDQVNGEIKYDIKSNFIEETYMTESSLKKLIESKLPSILAELIDIMNNILKSTDRLTKVPKLDNIFMENSTDRYFTAMLVENPKTIKYDQVKVKKSTYDEKIYAEDMTANLIEKEFVITT